MSSICGALGIIVDAPTPRGQCRSWVDFSGSIMVPRMAGIGATSPLTPVSAEDRLPLDLPSKFVVAKGRFGSASGRWPDLSPVRPSQGSPARPAGAVIPRRSSQGGCRRRWVLSRSRTCWRRWRRPGWISSHVVSTSRRTARFHGEPESPTRARCPITDQQGLRSSARRRVGPSSRPCSSFATTAARRPSARRRAAIGSRRCSRRPNDHHPQAASREGSHGHRLASGDPARGLTAAADWPGICAEASTALDRLAGSGNGSRPYGGREPLSCSAPATGQPRSRRLPIITYSPKIELSVIGLPYLVRAFGFAAMDQIVGVAIGLRTFDAEGFQILGNGPNDIVDGVIPRWVLTFFAGNTADFPIDRARTEWWPL